MELVFRLDGWTDPDVQIFLIWCHCQTAAVDILFGLFLGWQKAHGRPSHPFIVDILQEKKQNQKILFFLFFSLGYSTHTHIDDVSLPRLSGSFFILFYFIAGH